MSSGKHSFVSIASDRLIPFFISARTARYTSRSFWSIPSCSEMISSALTRLTPDASRVDNSRQKPASCFDFNFLYFFSSDRFFASIRYRSCSCSFWINAFSVAASSVPFLTFPLISFAVYRKFAMSELPSLFLFSFVFICL